MDLRLVGYIVLKAVSDPALKLIIAMVKTCTQWADAVGEYINDSNVRYFNNDTYLINNKTCCKCVMTPISPSRSTRIYFGVYIKYLHYILHNTHPHGWVTIRNYTRVGAPPSKINIFQNIAGTHYKVYFDDRIHPDMSSYYKIAAEYGPNHTTAWLDCLKQFIISAPRTLVTKKRYITLKVRISADGAPTEPVSSAYEDVIVAHMKAWADMQAAALSFIDTLRKD
jgi:hypothetical protein